MAYKIIRFYFKSGRKRVIKYVPTLELAQEHCKDRETSSTTCTRAVGRQRTKLYGPWFDGYEEIKA